MSELKRRRADLLPLGCVVLLAALHVMSLELREPNYFVRDDNAAFFLPLYVHSARTLVEAGEPALLNYHQYLGQTHFANGQGGAAYPPVYLAYVLSMWLWHDARAMIFLLVLGHLMAAAAGLFILARSWAVPRVVAAGVTVLWLTFPFLALVTRNWVLFAYSAAWVPWSLLLLDAWLLRGMRLGLAAYAVAKALFFFQGHPQHLVLSVLFEGVYVLWRAQLGGHWTSRAWWRRLGGLGVGLGASAALAAPLLLPMWQAKERSQGRAAGLSLEEYLSNALDLTIFARAQIFDLTGRAIHQSSPAIFYLGLPILATIACGAIWALRRRARPAHIVASAGTALVVLVLSTTAIRVLHGLPILGSFRWPFKSYLWVLFFAALATAATLGELWQRCPSGQKLDRRRAVVILVILLGIVGNLGAIWGDGWDRPFGPNSLRRTPEELRAELSKSIDLGAGRVVSMWMSHGQEDIERFLTHNYATVSGAYHLGGYDAMVSAKNFQLAKGLEYSNIWRYELTRESLDYLSEWSVRWLLMPYKPHNLPIVSSFPQLRVVDRIDGLLAVENTAAAPFAYLQPADGGAPLPLPVTFGGRGLSVDLTEAKGRPGRLRVQVAPLDGYEWSADGVSMGPVDVDPAEHVVVEVPGDTQRVEIRYGDPSLGVGVGLALATVLALAWFVGADPVSQVRKEAS